MGDDTYASVAELRRRLARRQTSAVELAKTALERLERVGKRLNAVAELTPDLALHQAERADHAIDSGRGGPLTGVPYGAKDLLATAGIPTRWGSPVHADQVFDHDAAVIERLREAGSVLVAKLALVEMAGGGGYVTPAAAATGPGLNPWDPSRWSGGSSSGSAIAVAAGLVPFAIGSETGGSLVLPSAYCGLTGLRPTFGRVSLYGAMPLAWSSDKLGPIAHTAADCAMVLGAIAGYDERDPVSARRSFRGPAPRRQLTIGVLQRDLDDAPRATVRAFEDVLHALRGLGHHLVTVTLPDVDWSRIFYVILGAETLAAHEDLIRSGRLDGLADAEQARGFRELESQELLPYVRAVQQRVASIRPVRDLFTSVDALVAPTTLTEAPPADADLAQYRGKRRGGNMHMGALIGLPELSLPMGHGDAGLPLGVSLIGDLYSEAVLLRAGIDLQKATDWHLAHPQVAG